MKKFKFLFAALLLSVSIAAQGGGAIIVHLSNNNSLTDKDIYRLFLGTKKTFPDGTLAIPINQKRGNQERISFLKVMLKKSPDQLRAYWATLIFTGRGTPPAEAKSSENVKKLISKNKNAIGYVDITALDGSVKVLRIF